jgi:hypothetical protein
MLGAAEPLQSYLLGKFGQICFFLSLVFGGFCVTLYFFALTRWVHCEAVGLNKRF